MDNVQLANKIIKFWDRAMWIVHIFIYVIEYINYVWSKEVENTLVCNKEYAIGGSILPLKVWKRANSWTFNKLEIVRQQMFKW